MKNNIDECMAWCNMFDVKWVHHGEQQFTLFIEPKGRVQRQITVTGTVIKTWRDAIKELLSDTPQKLW